MLDENKLNTAKEEIQFLQELDKKSGIDDFYAGLSYIALDTNQIKSATAMADKPTKDPRISYQLKPLDQPAELPDETWLEIIKRKVQTYL